MSAVLVVDDDSTISLNVAEVLSAAGFEPVVVYAAEHALAVLESRTDIEVLFTDIRLRGSPDGKGLAFAARRIQPAIHIVVSTGLAEFEIGDLPAGTIYLGKPYSEVEIEAAVKRALMSPTAGSRAMVRNANLHAET